MKLKDVRKRLLEVARAEGIAELVAGMVDLTTQVEKEGIEEAGPDPAMLVQRWLDDPDMFEMPDEAIVRAHIQDLKTKQKGLKDQVDQLQTELALSPSPGGPIEVVTDQPQPTGPTP